MANQITQSSEQVYQILRTSDGPFRVKTLRALRMKIENSLPHLSMSEQRKQYLLHQLAYIHEVEDLEELLQEINHSKESSQLILISKNTGIEVLIS